MPPKIHARRANISDEFIELIIALYKEWMLKNQGLIKQSVSNTRFEHYARTAQRMLPIIRRISDDRAGVDYEITRLRGLPFTDFLVVHDVDPTEQEDRIPWLVGRTRHVTITNYARRSEVMGELGRYDVYVPSSIVRRPELGHIHMIPQRNQRSSNRHPHHYLQTYGEAVAADRSPLSYPTGNCYGSYSAVIKKMVDLPDYPALFGQLYGHLSTYGDSPPIRMNNIDFDTITPER